MGNSDRNAWIKLFSFITLMLAALLILVNGLLPLIGIEVGGMFFNVLNTVKDIALLLGIAIGAFSFVKGLPAGKRKTWLIIYWIAVVIYVVGAFLPFFN